MPEQYDRDAWQSGAYWAGQKPSCIDVWLIRLQRTSDDSRTLSDDEMERANRLVIQEKRSQFIAGRTAMRRILGRYVDDVTFTYGEHGKPALTDPNSPAFNLSHSKDHAILAVCAEPGLGVDIEHLREVRKFERLAQRFFAAEESASLMALPQAERARAFYRAWTCKEAYLKAWGTGLTFPSNRFVIDFTNAGPARLLATEMPGDHDVRAWRFRDLPVPETFAGAVCWQHGEREVRLWRD